ncbi:hypothetical protein PR202_gb09841 [Eleusine coracana subsp. coracana]|uniref:Uncharacterized protein n=1 Tax=Eleusine coracana subsp. coracana TaxID=191504 RepID=A0AAV5EI74_ELECO|nr:hypothetical protein PR202_gb09841 [Eleusine coracana subsp. coracana]
MAYNLQYCTVVVQRYKKEERAQGSNRSPLAAAAAAMFHLHKLLLPVRRSASPVHYSLHRALLSTATASAAASPDHFAAEDYLVSTCGLTKEQAAKAAKHIAHCKSPSKADAVLSFLTSPALALSKADIAHLVSKDARVLNSSVDKTLRPRIDGLFSYGFTAAQIRTFLLRVPFSFRCFNTEEKLGFWLPLLGSPEKFLHLLRRNYYIVSSDLDGIVKVNFQVLRESGLSDDDVIKLCVTTPRLLTSKTDRVRVILNRAHELGVPPNSLMFRQAVATTSCIGPETAAAKLKFIGELLGCSDAEVATAVTIAPALLRCSMEKLHRASDFLTKVVGVDGKYILGRPTILMYSLERRIAPRHYVMKVLLEKGLLREEHSFYSLLVVTDKLFRSKYIIPHKDVLPGLAAAYASVCTGKLTT